MCLSTSTLNDLHSPEGAAISHVATISCWWPTLMVSIQRGDTLVVMLCASVSPMYQRYNQSSGEIENYGSDEFARGRCRDVYVYYRCIYSGGQQTTTTMTSSGAEEVVNGNATMITWSSLPAPGDTLLSTNLNSYQLWSEFRKRGRRRRKHKGVGGGQRPNLVYRYIMSVRDRWGIYLGYGSMILSTLKL